MLVSRILVNVARPSAQNSRRTEQKVHLKYLFELRKNNEVKNKTLKIHIGKCFFRK